ncbi:MAG: S-methyl-5-thioribose-1-phosphate isomerase [bacterium]
MPIRTLEWKPDNPPDPLPGHLVFIDQTRLPAHLEQIRTTDIAATWKAIRTLQIRGAPAIGIAAAYGVVCAVQATAGSQTAAMLAAVEAAADYLATSRPTAVNLFWALGRMRRTAHAAAALNPAEFAARMLREAELIRDEDDAMCRAIGRHGATLLRDGQTVLTHCNAGGLATSSYGTALAPIYVALEQGKRVKVYADETRPLFQGARLTAWELQQAGIEVTVICDNTAAWVMQQGRVDLVMVGADRIAANGDTANKIGTYGVACLAKAHGIPFYVLAPSSTFDLSLASGKEIPIEERAAEEVSRPAGGGPVVPDGVAVYAPAFDVTPAEAITAIVSERGILHPPYTSSLRA